MVWKVRPSTTTCRTLNATIYYRKVKGYRKYYEYITQVCLSFDNLSRDLSFTSYRARLSLNIHFWYDLSWGDCYNRFFLWPSTQITCSGRHKYRPNCQYFPQDCVRTGERLFLWMSLRFTNIRVFTFVSEYFVFYLNTKILTYEVTLFLAKSLRRMGKIYSSPRS